MPSKKTTHKHKASFVRSSPLAYVVVPVCYVLAALLVLVAVGTPIVSPYLSLWSWFTGNSSASQPQDLYAEAVAVINGEESSQSEAQQAETIPLSSIAYPEEGDRYGEITVEGTNVDAPLYYGDSTAVLNQGVGTYADDSRAGIPGESKTILLAGHNNTFFNDLQHAEVGATITVQTHYGTYTYEITEMEVKDYQDSTAYDFTRTDENLILYTCYPFDALGFTPDRYFVYAAYVSGPVLDANS